MYSSISRFLADWEQEAAATTRVMKALTDQSLGCTAGPGERSLGTLAWHIVLTLGEMGGKAGLDLPSLPEDSPAPSSSHDIAAGYEKAARLVAEKVRAQWADSTLEDTLEMYGSRWTRAGVLASLVKHQIHHRGQMTVLMRKAGIAVPGVYGPAREEWAAMGLPPMK
jgi:uncharacterized damage-inducible protein DinB